MDKQWAAIKMDRSERLDRKLRIVNFGISRSEYQRWKKWSKFGEKWLDDPTSQTFLCVCLWDVLTWTACLAAISGTLNLRSPTRDKRIQSRSLFPLCWEYGCQIVWELLMCSSGFRFPVWHSRQPLYINCDWTVTLVPGPVHLAAWFRLVLDKCRLWLWPLACGDWEVLLFPDRMRKKSHDLDFHVTVTSFSWLKTNQSSLI